MFVPRANSQKYDSSSISDDRSIRQGINESIGDGGFEFVRIKF